MSLDATLLKLLKYKDKYDLYFRAVNTDLLEPHTKVILEDYGRYFSEGAEVADANFSAWFQLARPKLKPEAKAVLLGIINAAQKDVPEEVEATILARLEETRQASTLTTVLERFNAGEEVSVLSAVRKLADSIPISKTELPFIKPNVDAWLKAETDDWGFQWSLDCLNQTMRPARPGDMIIMAARVDTGKTTSMIAELCSMAPQVDKLFPGEDRPIIVLNNESLGDRILSRAMVSTLNLPITEIAELRAKGQDVWGQTIKLWGGRQVIEVYDVHDRPLSFLEEIVRRRNPAIVAIDMLDNVSFDGDTNNGGQRTDQILEAAYQRARIWAVKYNCVVIPMSQLSADAAGDPYPGMHLLANSRTGKAGAADVVMMLGSSLDPGLRNSRWISLPKNKLARGNNKDPRCEVIFDGARARLKNPVRIEYNDDTNTTDTEAPADQGGLP